MATPSPTNRPSSTTKQGLFADESLFGNEPRDVERTSDVQPTTPRNHSACGKSNGTADLATESDCTAVAVLSSNAELSNGNEGRLVVAGSAAFTMNSLHPLPHRTLVP